MGCSLQKQPEESYFQTAQESFCCERLEWVNMLRQNDIQMDQKNLEVAQERLSHKENSVQERFTNLQEDEKNLETQRILMEIIRFKRKRYITQ